ncbi:MAG: hypothetical protein A4E66_01736 [Syntrophus sp. PtaB.Bin001]|jgi:hypothetical protein|nr:MAG: hypothetical protein A4E66_02677 [Syntrophus sp. PtaB.Bin001]OPY09357.1 MAG: hypothetical protein A4E66_01736 [Syntrophus sp. PtaB.Bin001]
MKTDHLLILSLVLFLLTSWAWASPANQANSCVSCHTNDKLMKTLVKPPVISGEGEG